MIQHSSVQSQLGIRQLARIGGGATLTVGAALLSLGLLAAVLSANSAADVETIAFTGTVVDQNGKPVRGATVSLFPSDMTRSVSVYSQPDGGFAVPSMPVAKYKLRVRLLGLHDEWLDLKRVPRVPRSPST